jgi:AAA+ superfamily predicted ATPase
MSTGLLRAIEKLIEQFVDEQKLTKPFYKAGAIPPLKILSISNALPSLNLASEEILFCYDRREMNIFKGFVLTDKNFHFVLEKATAILITELDKKINEKTLSQILGDEYKELAKPLNELLHDIATGNFDKKPANKTSVKNDVKEFIDETNFEIPSSYLDVLQVEGLKLFSIIETLNEDKEFLDVLQKSLTKSDVLKDEFKTHHVVLQDAIEIYNQLFSTQENENIKGKFALAYLFERLQGNDFAENLSLERINEMVANPKFLESIAKVKNAKFLTPSDEYKDQFILPSILFRVQHKQFDALAAAYNQLAVILANTDNAVSDDEQKTLERIQQLCFHPKKNLTNVKQSSVPEDDTLEKVMAEINELVGLKNIKTDIQDLVNFLKVQKIRETQGLKATERMLHSVFMGPPGTGKTTIARLLGRIYKHLGYLSSGHIVETDRAGLVAGYVGQTALKVDEVVKAAINGVLFIDEAYALAKDDSGKDFGNEAIETLLKRMEDHRDDLAVIAAGYPDEMKTFIQSNPGLQSRFNRYFRFEHYTPQEMMDIFKGIAKKADFALTADAEEKLQFIFDGLYEKRNSTFGNARVVRNIFEQVIAIQANRIVAIPEITKEILMALEEADIPEVKETIQKVFVF